MSKYCPKCWKKFLEDDKNFCDHCGSPLVAEPSEASGVSVNLDASAVSGGIHNTDSHNVDSHNISDSHNVTHITNYVQESKNPDAQKLANITKFRDLCKRIIKPGGRLSQEGKESLEVRCAYIGIHKINLHYYYVTYQS